MEAGQAAVAHGPIGVAAVKAAQDGFVRARVEGDQDALKAFGDAAVAADGFDGAVVVANAEAADVEIDELGFIAGGAVEGLQIGLRAFWPGILFGHQGAQVSLRGGDAFGSPKTIGLDFEAFLQGNDFGDVHERKMEHSPQMIRASAVKMRPRSSGRLVAAASITGSVGGGVDARGENGDLLVLEDLAHGVFELIAAGEPIAVAVGVVGGVDDVARMRGGELLRLGSEVAVAEACPAKEELGDGREESQGRVFGATVEVNAADTALAERGGKVGGLGSRGKEVDAFEGHVEPGEQPGKDGAAVAVADADDAGESGSAIKADHVGDGLGAGTLADEPRGEVRVIFEFFAINAIGRASVRPGHGAIGPSIGVAGIGVDAIDEEDEGAHDAPRDVKNWTR